jgi:hypothetical protein
VVLGTGTAAVLLVDTRPPPLDVLRRVFAGTDGLTSFDADEVVRAGTGYVVDGIHPGGAAALVGLLTAARIDVVAIDDGRPHLPPAVLVTQFVVASDPAPALVAHFAVGAPVRLAPEAVVAAVAAVVTLATTASWEPAPSPAALVDVLAFLPGLGGPTLRRLRLQRPLPSSALSALFARALDVDEEFRPVVEALPRWGRLVTRLDPLSSSTPSPVPVPPRLRTLREVERALGWTAWRATRGA